MKTVSTLCATSTIGVAACGLALGRPNHQEQLHDNSQLRNSLEEDCPSPLPSSIRKSWIRRFSETVSNVAASVPTSRNTAPRPQSALATSQYTSASTAAGQHSQGLPTQSRNKLVKRSISRASCVSPQPHSPTGRSSSRLSLRPFSAKQPVVYGSTRTRTESPVPTEPPTARPSTTLFNGAEYQPYNPSRVNNWKLFFRPRRQKTKHLTPPSIKRIYPDQKSCPTLTYPQLITYYDSETESTYSPANSIYCESRPITPSSPFPVVEERQQQEQQQVDSSTRTRRRSFSISTLLPSQRAPSRTESTRSRRLSIDVVFRRPTTANRTNPYPSTSSRTAMAGQHSEEQSALATLQSISHLSINTDNNASSTAVVSPQSQQFGSDSHLPTDHRGSQLSISGNSERASTLVGSDVGDVDAEEGFDDMSETVFDSLRTRLSEVPPHAEHIFGENGSSSNRLTEDSKQKLDRQGNLANRLSGAGGWRNDEEEEDWGSEWDATSNDGKSNDLDATPKPKPQPKPDFARLLNFDKTPLLDTSFGGFKDRNKSNSSFNSLGDWDDEERDVPESPTKAKSRNETLAFHSLRLGRQAPPVHARSRSVPVSEYSRARVSENWDDDFDECTGPEVHIPDAICAVQDSVLDHLSYVKEFASLVEDLKRLRTLGNSTGARFGPARQLWEEAEGIIALATLEDEDSAPSTTPSNATSVARKVRPSFDSSTFDPPATPPKKIVRKSILPDDDAIFGPNLIPRSPQSSPSRNSIKRAPSVKEDRAAEAAAKLIQRVNRRTYDAPDRKSVVSTLSGFSEEEEEGTKKVQFDTSMLGELVVRVTELISEMENALGEMERKLVKRGGSPEKRRSGMKEVFDLHGRVLECST